MEGLTREDIKEAKGILIDIGLIIEFDNRNYKEYLQEYIYNPMSIRLNLFIRSLLKKEQFEVEQLIERILWKNLLYIIYKKLLKY